MTLVFLLIFPIIVFSGVMNTRLISGMSGKNKNALEEAGKIAVEAIGNSKTVASLVIEEEFQKAFFNTIHQEHKAVLIKSHLSGFLFAFSQAIVYCSYGLAFYYGATLIENMETTFSKIMRVFACIVFCSTALGQTAGLAPDFGKATCAARRIFALLDTVPSANAALDIGCKPTEGTFKYNIHFQDVHFAYANRPDVKVLQGFNTTIRQGQTVALVGSSGCGKSTVISLLEQFYSFDHGNVSIDNYSISDLNTKWLRAQLGLVSQEPSLFNCSIAENIAYGDNCRVVEMDEIIRAAKNANIHHFIEALPKGYETNVGDRGTQLSGGQKQRIAIARALVRDPKILLLDEATSALDTESEKIVQEALDKAKQGRTCIVIAHRLSTIINSEKIVVIEKGAVAEQGTHQELMANKGIYYKLNMIQNRIR